jgi:hypothetical protein
MTSRTNSELQTLFADNTAGAISPQDLRDFLDSVTPKYGSLYYSTPAATTIAVAGTYYKAAGTTTALNLNEFTMPANNRLTYTGTTDVHLHIAYSLSCTCSGNTQVLGFSLAKNGTNIAESKLTRKVGTGSDVGAVALHWDLTVSTNDYIELFVTNETSTATITIEQGYLFAMTMIT